VSPTLRVYLALALFVVASGCIVALDAAAARAAGVVMLVAAIVLAASALLTHATLSATEADASGSPPPTKAESPGSPLP
jgi:hypothetical protein